MAAAQDLSVSSPTHRNLSYPLPLEDAQSFYEQAKSARVDAVKAARASGQSWYAIGSKLGMSHVAARRLYLRNGGEA